MKQIIQNYKTGEIDLFEVPVPLCQENGCIVKTSFSLLSAGTEKLMIDMAKKSLIGKAKARPDLVKQVIDKMKKDGIKNTLEKVFTKLSTPIPLGYSLSGKVIEIGENVTEFNIGDRVACGGAGYANHSEFNYIPKNLMVKIPDEVNDIEASFVTVGAIALQGVRKLNPFLGEKIAVIGLGLIGQLTAQILKANGCQVIGIDIDSDKLKLAQEFGIDVVSSPDNLLEKSAVFSNGYGVDGVIVTASTKSNQPIIDAATISRMRGRVVVVGMVGMEIPRDEYYKKELELKLSMSYGPGRYDPVYEEEGCDYPYDLVRFTEQRNFEVFLELLKNKSVNVEKIITHTFEFEKILEAYQLLENKSKEKYLGIILKYNNSTNFNRVVEKRQNKINKSNNINLGFIGAGNFVKGVLLPTINKIDGFNYIGLCTATGVTANFIGEKYNFKYITTDSKEIFNNNSINTVIVATKHNDHYNKIIKAIKHKKNIFIEKPLCIKEEELEDIKKQYNGDIVLQVGFNRRFSSFIKKIKENVTTPCSINYRISAGIIPKDLWYQNKDIGGGRIIGEICHFIDTCSYIANSKVIEVVAFCINKKDNSIPNEDNVSILLKYENGSTANITYFAYGDNTMPKEYIEVFANGTSITMNDFKEIFIFKNSKKSKIKTIAQDKGFKNEFIAFKNAINTGELAIPFDSIYNTTKTTFKVLESLQSNKIIQIV